MQQARLIFFKREVFSQSDCATSLPKAGMAKGTVIKQARQLAGDETTEEWEHHANRRRGILQLRSQEVTLSIVILVVKGLFDYDVKKEYLLYT